MPEPATDPIDRTLLLLTAVVGMAAIIALPLSVTAPGLAVLLVFSVPLLLALAGKQRAQPMLIVIGGVLLLAVTAAIAVQSGIVTLVPVIALFAGPILAVLLVGIPLRTLDVPAAAAFLIGGTIAVVAGFATAGIDRGASAAMVIGVGVVALAITAARLRRLGDAPG